MKRRAKKSKSTASSSVERDAKGRIVKGSGSLNPGGRPRDEREVVEALRLHGLELVDALLRLALRRKPNVKAIEVAFAYAYGKPRQPVELTGRNGEPIAFDLSKLTDEQLDQLERLHTLAAGGTDAAEPH